MRPIPMTDHIDAPRSNPRVPRNQRQTASFGQIGYHFDQASPAPGLSTPSHFHTHNTQPTSTYPPSPSRLPSTNEHQFASYLHFTSINDMVPHTMGNNNQGDTRDPQYHRGSVYYNPRTAPQYPATAQPNMANHSLNNNGDAELYYFDPTAQQPLANSMYVVGTNDQIPTNPHMIDRVAEMSQLEHRVDKVERQQFQGGLNAQFDHISTARSLRDLQREVLQMKRAIENNIPELRHTITTLKAKLEVKENEECTRLIQIEPRTQEEKLESAMKNANLDRIASGAAMPRNLTYAEFSIRGAAQMESLAKTLRSRVHKGGAAYILEAEDAEAWAAKLREDVSHVKTPAEIPVPQLQRSKEVLTVEMIKKHMVDTEMLEMLKKHNTSSKSKRAAAEDAKDDDEMAKTEPQEHTRVMPAEDALDEQFADPWVMVAESPNSESAASSMKANSTVHKAESLTSTTGFRGDEEPSIQLPTARASKLAPHRRHASEHTEVSKLSTSESAVTIKIEDSPTSDIKSLQAVARSVVKSPITRGRELAPHQKFAAQQAQALEPSIHETVLEAPKAVVPETEIEAADENTPSGNTETCDVAEVAKVAEVQVPVVRTKKPAPHRRCVTQQVEASDLPGDENDVTTKDEASLSQAEKLESERKQEVQQQATDRDTADRTLSQDSLEPKEEASIEPLEAPIQDTVTQTNLEVTINNSTWQPTYLKALPSLPTEELETIPSPGKMHRFNRSFILNHLGGTRWLPSFYCVPEPERSLLPNRGFFLLEDIHEPLGPSTPGSHGSLLTPIIRLPGTNNPNIPKQEAMQNAPLFVKQGDGYIFCGMYTYLRADRLDIERCDVVVPSSLKTFWAQQLTSAQRPKWVTEALQKHLLPPPIYTGPLPGHADEDQVNTALGVHVIALEAWHRDTHFKTSFLRPEHIITAFSAPDTGAEMPGIRFWNLGLKCEGWDKGFYDMMVREEGIWEREGSRDGEGERERKVEMMRMLRPRSKRPKKW